MNEYGFEVSDWVVTPEGVVGKIASFSGYVAFLIDSDDQIVSCPVDELETYHRYAIWCLPAEGSWSRYTRYSTNLDTTCALARTFADQMPYVDWSVRAGDGVIDVLFLQATRMEDANE